MAAWGGSASRGGEDFTTVAPYRGRSYDNYLLVLCTSLVVSGAVVPWPYDHSSLQNCVAIVGTLSGLNGCASTMEGGLFFGVRHPSAPKSFTPMEEVSHRRTEPSSSHLHFVQPLPQHQRRALSRQSAADVRRRAWRRRLPFVASTKGSWLHAFASCERGAIARQPSVARAGRDALPPLPLPLPFPV